MLLRKNLSRKMSKVRVWRKDKKGNDYIGKIAYRQGVQTICTQYLQKNEKLETCHDC